MFSISDLELNAIVTGFMWPFIRILAMIQTAPVLGHRAISVRFKVGIAVLVAILIGPLLPASSHISIFSFDGVLAVFQQIFVGASIGFGLRVVFAAFELAGDLIGLQMGLGFASFIDPARNAPSPLLGTVLIFIANLVFLSTNGHLALFMTIHESFIAIPVSTHVLDQINWLKLAGLGALVFSAGIQVALPVLAAILTLNIGLGFVARSAPQLNIFNIGFAITLLSGMMALWLTIGAMAAPIERITGIQVPYLLEPQSVKTSAAR